MPSEAPRDLLKPEHLDAARRAQEAFGLCDHCLGRLFGKVETGLRNPERAAIIREAAPDLPVVAVAACAVCEGLFDELDAFAAIAAEAKADWEHATFLVGTRVDHPVTDREREIWDALDLAEGAEPVNTALNREIGIRVSEATDKPVDFKRPDVTVIVDTRFNVAELEHRPLCVFARYRKFDRTLPQTQWDCRTCRGRGCRKCGGTGKQYPSSVQELVAHEALRAGGATQAAFHGAGREDVDARCLGRGRPFVLELKDPRVRSLDLPGLEAAINAHARPRVEVEGLRFVEKKEVQRVKESRGSKTYVAETTFETAVEEANLFEAVAGLRGCTIAQRTPSRVKHRRADLVRKRRVHTLDVDAFDGASATLRIRGDAGLYIKELISGDDGRTDPSLAGLLGVKATVTALDIADVEYDDPPMA